MNFIALLSALSLSAFVASPKALQEVRNVAGSTTRTLQDSTQAAQVIRAVDQFRRQILGDTVRVELDARATGSRTVSVDSVVFASDSAVAYLHVRDGEWVHRERYRLRRPLPALPWQPQGVEVYGILRLQPRRDLADESRRRPSQAVIVHYVSRPAGPLIILNGTPLDASAQDSVLATLRAVRIDSIRVFPAGSATEALFGTKGAQGVVILSTGR